VRALSRERLSDALDTAALPAGVVDLVWELLGDGGRRDLARATHAILHADYRARASENALRVAVRAERRDPEAAFLTDGAHLDGAQLAGEDLAGARLVAASLRGADLTGADLTGADLTGADLTDAQLDGPARE
jgi:uncharacterized protein YjbI with pentapeptide repeats